MWCLGHNDYKGYIEYVKFEVCSEGKGVYAGVNVKILTPKMLSVKV